MLPTCPTPCIEFAPPLAHCRAMNASWKTVSLAALGAMWTAVAADAREQLPGDRTLTVIVWDYAGVSDSSLDEMEKLSVLLLFRAGIGTKWVHCLGHQQGPRPALCDANLTKGSVLLRIVVAYPGNQNKRGDPLGTAMVESGYASIYATEIHKYAAHNGLSDGTLMAYAGTHEIGHLLLGPNHTSSGIMRAVWGVAEYRGMDQRWLGFGAAERHSLWRAVPALDQLVTGLK
jgi:hypothetical protein